MTKYEPRPPQTYPYCDCGHGWGTHDIFNIKESLKGILRMLFCSNISHAGKCDKCMCPRYNQFGRFSNEEECRKKLESKDGVRK